MPRNPTTVLTSNGLQNAPIIVHAAQESGLLLATAATLVEMESGGRNVWGHDPVATGGCYVPGGPVTPENYRAYRRSPVAGWQGVGLTQLTYKGFIYEAEKLNPDLGAADPYTNCLVGFRAFLGMWKATGENVRAAFQRYNGGTSGSSASVRYSEKAMVRRDKWRALLG